jgi:hypothetical protein
MFVAGVVCPHPPLLLPPVAPQPEQHLGRLRDACTRAVADLLAARPDVVVCVGEGPEPGRYDDSDGGTLRDFGVAVHAGGDGDALPLALTVGAWLLDDAGWTGPRRYVALPQETTPDDCVAAGASVAAADLRVAVLALGDGSARHSTSAPGYLDERAEPFDREVGRALGAADLAWVAGGIPPLACAELWVAGRPAWQFLAGAARCTAPGAGLRACTHFDDAPFGVGYFVVTWSVAEAAVGAGRRPRTAG